MKYLIGFLHRCLKWKIQQKNQELRLLIVMLKPQPLKRSVPYFGFLRTAVSIDATLELLEKALYIKTLRSRG